jgi:hypothetical protein
MSPKRRFPQFPSIALASAIVVISLPWVALSLYKIGDSCLHCPRFPSGLVKELVTLSAFPSDRLVRKLARMMTSFASRMSRESISQSAFFTPCHAIAPARAVLSGRLPGAGSTSDGASSPFDILGQEYIYASFEMGQ